MRIGRLLEYVNSNINTDFDLDVESVDASAFLDLLIREQRSG